MRRLVLITCVALTGCRCGDDVKPVFGEGLFVAGDGVIIVDEEATLDFGRVPFGETRELSVSVRNSGDGSLEVERATGIASPFTLLAVLPLTLGTTETQAFTVRFAPPLDDEHLLSSTYELRVQLALAGTESPTNLTVHVRGEGYALDNCVLLMPETLDLGDVELGCSETREITITNGCTRELHLDSMTLSGDDFSVSPALETGGRPLIVVQPQPFSVRFDAVDAGEATGAIHFGVTQGRLQTSRVMGLSANAVPRAPTVDSFTVRHEVDILVVPAGSNVGVVLEPTFADGIDQILGELSDSGVDFHLGFLSAYWDYDTSCPGDPACAATIGPVAVGALVPPDGGTPLFLQPSTPDLFLLAHEVLLDTLQPTLPEYSGRLIYFESTRRALTPPLSTGENAPFFREGVSPRSRYPVEEITRPARDLKTLAGEFRYQSHSTSTRSEVRTRG